MEKRQKKILLLSIFGGAAAIMIIGYFAFLLWAFTKAFPNASIKDSAVRFIELIQCASNNPGVSGKAANEKCVQDWLTSQKTEVVDKKREENPEYNACMYEQETLLEALSASKVQGEEILKGNIAKYCDFQTNPTSSIDDTNIYSGYTALKLLKDELASQAILNYRYQFFKKKNYPLELEALEAYRGLINKKSCDNLASDIDSLEKRGSVFVLGTKAVCEIQDCSTRNLSSCPEAGKLAERMKALGDIAGEFILMYQSMLKDKQGAETLKHARLALLKGYTDAASDYPELAEDDFYQIKFTPEMLTFSAARLMNAQKIYTPALNCVAASLNKNWEFETLRKTPKAFSAQQWSEKITKWATEDSELLMRLACEVLTDVESKKKLHNFYMNDGNEDGSAFDFCKMIDDPLFKDVCKAD